MQASVHPACPRRSLTQEEGAGGKGDAVGQQLLQEEGEEVAVEVAVEDLEPSGSEEEAAGAEGEPGAKQQPSPTTPLKMEHARAKPNTSSWCLSNFANRSSGKIVISTN